VVISGESTNVTFKNAIILGDVYAYKTDSESVAFGNAEVKYAGTSYKLWMTAAGAADAALDNGASVRAEAESQGIRFTGSAAKVEGATYGILIAPADYVAAAGAFTKEALDDYAKKVGKAASAVYQMVEADKSLNTEGEKVTFSVALINIQEANYGRSFAAVAFVTIGETTTYSAYDSANNARSAKEIATGLLAQEHTKEITEEYTAEQAIAEGFIYKIEEGVYSKYSTTAIAKLNAYAGN
jgi:hypothetical protein